MQRAILLSMFVVAILTGFVAPLDAQELVAVDGQVRVRFSGLVLNRKTNTFDTVASITNVSGGTLRGPLSLVVTRISRPGVDLVNQRGRTPDRNAFVAIPLTGGTLTPGARANSIALKFANPARVKFTFTVSVVAGRMPTSQDLIRAALRAGRIDYPTSLLYRIFALFSDSRLPEEFDGAGSDGEDSGLFQEISLRFAALPAATQAALRPYLLRPDEAGSAFARPAGRALSLRAQGTIRAQGAIRAQDDTGTACPTLWVGQHLPGGHFKVWLCITADAAGDEALRQRVLQTIEPLWPEMTKSPPNGMGLPKSDCPDPDHCRGGDSLVDVYLLATAQCKLRGGQCFPIPIQDSIALAVPDLRPEPDGSPPKKASGYILLDRARAGVPAALKNDFAHEFFHVLQFAHNVKALFRDTGAFIGNDPISESSWFMEASATWAEWRYVPATAGEEVHPWFVDDFQPRPSIGLQALSPRYHPYAAYIWPFFMQQEVGDRAIFQAWVAAESAVDPSGIDDAVDAQLGFEDHFRDFAVRNLNLSGDLLTGSPIRPLYSDLDRRQFPVDHPPQQTNDGTIRLSAIPSTDVVINALGAQYDLMRVDNAVREVVFDFTELDGADTLQVDFIADIRGTWKRISPSGLRVKFCRDVPDQDVSVTWIVLSNFNRATPDPVIGLTTASPITGSYTIERRAACSGFTGTITRVLTGPEFVAGPVTVVVTPGAQREEQRWVLQPETTRQFERVGRDDRIFNVDAAWTLTRTSSPSRTVGEDSGGRCTVTTERSMTGAGTGQGAVTITFFAPTGPATPAPQLVTGSFAGEDHTRPQVTLSDTVDSIDSGPSASCSNSHHIGTSTIQLSEQRLGIQQTSNPVFTEDCLNAQRDVHLGQDPAHPDHLFGTMVMTCTNFTITYTWDLMPVGTQ